MLRLRPQNQHGTRCHGMSDESLSSFFMGMAGVPLYNNVSNPRSLIIDSFHLFLFALEPDLLFNYIRMPVREKVWGKNKRNPRPVDSRNIETATRPSTEFILQRSGRSTTRRSSPSWLPKQDRPSLVLVFVLVLVLPSSPPWRVWPGPPWPPLSSPSSTTGKIWPCSGPRVPRRRPRLRCPLVPSRTRLASLCSSSRRLSTRRARGGKRLPL